MAPATSPSPPPSLPQEKPGCGWMPPLPPRAQLQGTARSPLFLCLASLVLERRSHFLEMAAPPSWTADLGRTACPSWRPSETCLSASREDAASEPEGSPGFLSLQGPWLGPPAQSISQSCSLAPKAQEDSWDMADLIFPPLTHREPLSSCPCAGGRPRGLRGSEIT